MRRGGGGGGGGGGVRGGEGGDTNNVSSSFSHKNTSLSGLFYLIMISQNLGFSNP